MPDISLRARKILQAVVSEYLSGGVAVGSRTVTRRHGIGLSPATVRNVMADLEELGLLEQPHTSAGRIPTPTGLRFFIDSLLTVRGLSPKEKEAIRLQLGGGAIDLGDVAQRTSRLLSEVTPHAGLVLAPHPTSHRFRHIEFVPLSESKFICILVTTEGHIENRLLDLDVEVDSSQLERVHRYLAELLQGMTLDEMRTRVVSELGKEKNLYDEMVSAALRLSKAALDQPDGGAEVVVSGHANLLESSRPADDQDLARMRVLLQALEDKEVLVRLLDKARSGHGIQVFLGADSTHEALGAASLVGAPYGPNDHPLGAIAVIGPMRMNYGRVMAVVDFTAELVSALMSGR